MDSCCHNPACIPNTDSSVALKYQYCLIHWNITWEWRIEPKKGGSSKQIIIKIRNHSSCVALCILKACCPPRQQCSAGTGSLGAVPWFLLCIKIHKTPGHASPSFSMVLITLQPKQCQQHRAWWWLKYNYVLSLHLRLFPPLRYRIEEQKGKGIIFPGGMVMCLMGLTIHERIK